MGDNSVNKSILIEDEEEESSTGDNKNTFPEAVKEMGEILFNKYPKKTSNLSYENINGIIRAEVLNEYMDVNFGYRYKCIDALIVQKQTMMISHEGFGVEKIIEFVKGIQASFEQTQIPEGIRGMLSRGR